MAHDFTFTVKVTLERSEGKFAPRDEMVDSLIEELESAQPSSIDGLGADGTTSYEVVEFEVEEA